MDKELLLVILNEIRTKADIAYCEYIRNLQQNECLGWEAKVKNHQFGKVELDAHCKAAEELSRHRALHEVANLLEKSLVV